LFEKIISPENILCAWREFQKDKKNREDVQEFEANVEENIFKLCDDLAVGNYLHGGYKPFYLRDPKLRMIHKASVRDRLLHHAVFRVLYPIFDRGWIYDSFSSRESKGTHAAMKRFRDFAWKVSQNNTRPVWVLKADVRKYFDSIDHHILEQFLYRALPDNDRLKGLLHDIISSYSTVPGKGIPLGNLTSQLFANVYLNPLDQYVKRQLQVPYYIRYADDIIIVSGSKKFLADLVPSLNSFLRDKLQLTMHPQKISISCWNKGIDILGFVSYPTKTIMRASTEYRMMRRLDRQNDTANFDIQLNALYSRVKYDRQ
jgi:retron-type reverse transcriptase